MAKVKRYNGMDGSMAEEDVRSFAGTPENDSNAGMAEATETKAEAAPTKATSFKSAFAAARGAGDKTFEWNGKKYTTELAGSSKPAASSKPAVSSRSTASTAKGEDQYDANVKQGPKKGQYMSLQDRQREYEKARAASGTGMYGTRKSEPAEAKKTPGRGVIDTKNINPKTLLPSKGMKEGGGVKGWGSARGARKAKIY